MTGLSGMAVTLICATAVVECVVTIAALYVGYHFGYWKRVQEEKDARGIR